METCTIAVPVLAATETLTVDDVDVTPTDDGSNGNPPGYGDGFSGGVVDAAGTTTATLTAGATTAISLQLGAVSAVLYDCGSDATSNPAYAAYDYDWDDGGTSTGNGSGAGRLVFAQGTAGWIIVDPAIVDADYDWLPFASPSPALVDVNASPVPVTVTSANQHITLLTMPGTQTTGTDPTPPPTGYGASASIPNQSYMFVQSGYALPIYVEYDGNASATSGTITIANNLTATDLFGNSLYSSTMTYNVAIFAATPLALTLETSPTAGDHAGTVTVTDYAAVDGGLVYPAGCLTPGNVEVASISSPGAFNTTTWQEPLTVTAMATGTCSFVVSDGATGVGQQVTVTVPD
jgi:hypothetical protein